GRRWILVATVILALLAGAFGGGVANHLSSGGFDDPNSESSKAADALLEVFHTGQPNLVLLVKARAGSVEDPAVAGEGLSLTRRLGAEPHMSDVVSYWSLRGAPPLRSKDGTEALILGRIQGDDDQVRDRVKVLSPRYTLDEPAVTVRVGGRAEVFRQVGTQVEKDLQRAE